MNISHKHKVIWWAPERCGTKITREIFSDYDFFVYNPKTNDEISLKERYTSHFNQIPEEFSNYKLICSVRNPYDRILAVFLLTQYGDVVIEKSIYLKIKERFNKWVLESFIKRKTLVELSKFNQTQNINYNFFSKWTFESRIPDYFIRMENLKEDLENLDFIKTHSLWDEEKNSQKIENNRFITTRPLKFNEIYDFESAKRIYYYYKKVFNLIPYDPFSFTKENLTDNQKYSFLHNIL
jgi:hypothetical protein